MAQVGVLSARSAAFADFLLDEGLIDRGQLELARRIKARSGGHIDEILVSLGVLSPTQLRDAMARAYEMPMVDLTRERVDEGFVREFTMDEMLALNAMPLRRLWNGTALIATSRPVDAQRHADAEARLGTSVLWAAAMTWDIRARLLDVFGADIADDAANELFRQNPAVSARITLSRGQRAALVVVMMVVGTVAVLRPAPTLVAACLVVALGALAVGVFRFSIAMRGARYDVVQRITALDVAELNDDELPVYSILARVGCADDVTRLVRHVNALEWPADRLDVIVLIEEADEVTRRFIDGLDVPATVHPVVVPPGSPFTRARALNVGLHLAVGEYLVIFDPDDVTEADQLKKAFIAFQRSHRRTVCVQASLAHANADASVLTRMGTVEHAYWFDYVLPGLDAMNLPIPLGGTSNHFRTRDLLELGGWDPYNVNEDVDLGIRASALGYRVGMIDSMTLDRAPEGIGAFLRQHSRGSEGYVQTALVHSRRPGRLVRSLGLGRTASFGMLIAGTAFADLAALPLALVAVGILTVPNPALATIAPAWLTTVVFLTIAAANALRVYISMMGPYKRGAFRSLLWAMLAPVSWVIYSAAAWWGLARLLAGSRDEAGSSRVRTA